MTLIKVSNLSKKYRLGLKVERNDTLFDSILVFLSKPYRNYQLLKGLSNFERIDESLFLALNDVSFKVNEGDVLGIIGKNGAGKSTLLKILSQITDPSSGKIEIQGRIASLLEVGTGFHPELTGRENIYMNGTILGMTRKEIDSKLDEIIDFSGVEKFIDTATKFYSSGMKVRLGFSVAAHLDPEILIIDEVLAVGDYDFQKKCLGKMEEVNKRYGRTVLFVSHQLSMISSLCSRTILLDKGHVVYDGNTNEAISIYLRNSTQNNDFSILEGNKNIILSDILVNEGVNLILSNRYFSIRLSFISILSVIKKEARIDLRIDDVFGNGLIWMTTRTNSEINLNSSVVNFHINKLPLVPGEYYITVYIHDGSSVASYYPSVKSFFVSDSTYFLNEIKIPNGQTPFIVEYVVS